MRFSHATENTKIITNTKESEMKINDETTLISGTKRTI